MTNPRYSALLVIDDPATLALTAGQLDAEFDVRTATTAGAARLTLAAAPADIVVADVKLPDETGFQLLDWVRHNAPRTGRILLIDAAEVAAAADAVNTALIRRIVLKPWRAEDLIANLRRIARNLALERENEKLLDELRSLNSDLEHRVEERTRELEHALQQLQVKNQILEKMALTDALTGLPNRRAIELLARKELLRRTRTPAPIAFGLVDADRFKDINSAYLLSGGDHVLIWLGQVLQGAIRATDALGRVGGEEFMVVAPATDAEGAEVLAERLRETVEGARTQYREWEITLTVSVGFAVAEANTPVGYDVLRDAAAAALAEAKATGRNRSVVRTIS